MRGSAAWSSVACAALAAGLAACAAGLAACAERPSDRQLELWRQEATEANAQALTRALGERPIVAPGWTLGLAGHVAHPGETLGWKDIDALATTHVRTRSPQNPAAPDAIVDFRGVRVADLLARAGAADSTDEEITFVAYDAFRATVKLADVRRFPVTLAIEADGKPIARASGGPVFLVFPHTEFPETVTLYPDRYWCFYVTHMIVGTEAIALRVRGPGAAAAGPNAGPAAPAAPVDTTLDAAALAALPQATQKGTVAFKVHWPSNEVLLSGVHLSDVLAAAHVTIPPGGFVTLRGKAPIQRDPAAPLRIAGADLATCDPLLVTHFGADHAPVTARLGGPLAVAIPPACADRYGDKLWVTFLEELEVAP